MKYTYLIPANTKKSLLIFGVFNTIDMIIFGIGVGVSLLLMAFMPVEKFAAAIVAISPALITGLLVFPVANYHNVRTVIKNAWIFYTTRQKYIWKGWCFENGETREK